MSRLRIQIPETVLRRLDRISPVWSKNLRDGRIYRYMRPSISVLDRGENTDDIGMLQCRRCIVGEAHGWSAKYTHESTECVDCAQLCSDLTDLLYEDDGAIVALQAFIDHYEYVHMKKPIVEKVPVEIEVK